MIIHREIRSSYHHKPKVQGVDYSPFIMVMMVEMLEKMETTPAAPRRSFPPSNLQLQVFCFVVLCFHGAPLRKPSGDYFYSHF